MSVDHIAQSVASGPQVISTEGLAGLEIPGLGLINLEALERFAGPLLDTAAMVPAILPAALGCLLTLLFCGAARLAMARDWEPVMGQPVTRPAGLSAATLRYVRTGRFDAASLTASIQALAAKGAVTVEYEPRAVRLRKVAESISPLTRAEAAFAGGLMRMRSNVVLNPHAGPALSTAAAALQDGVAAEWRGYQTGRLRHHLRPATLVGLLTALVASLTSGTPLWTGLQILAVALGLVLMGRFLAGIIRARSRLWRDPGLQTASVAFQILAMAATLGTVWMVLTYGQANIFDVSALGASVIAGVALALPFLCARWLGTTRAGAGTLRGRIDALRNQLLGKAQGISEIGLAQRPARSDGSTRQPETLWVADAIALDAVRGANLGRIARLRRVLEDPSRLGAVLKATTPERPPEQFTLHRGAFAGPDS